VQIGVLRKAVLFRSSLPTVSGCCFSSTFWARQVLIGKVVFVLYLATRLLGGPLKVVWHADGSERARFRRQNDVGDA